MTKLLNAYDVVSMQYLLAGTVKTASNEYFVMKCL